MNKYLSVSWLALLFLVLVVGACSPVGAAELAPTPEISDLPTGELAAVD